MIDIDHFQDIERYFWPSVGDQLFARRYPHPDERHARSRYVARYGGEEFVIILPETTGNRRPVVAQRLRRAVERQVFLPAHRTLSSISPSALAWRFMIPTRSSNAT